MAPKSAFTHPGAIRPSQPLVTLSEAYLQTAPDAIVVCENLVANRATYANMPSEYLPPISCFGDDEVYHLLQRKHIGLDAVEDSIRMSQAHWGIGVCSRCDHVPEGDIPGEAFFDAIVSNTKYVFMPAFDGDGFLIWSPKSEG